MPKYSFTQYDKVTVNIEVNIGEVKDLVRILQEAGNNATSKYSSERVAHREWTAILQNAIREVKSSVEWDRNIHDRPIEYKETA
tara:strand:- start:533 stop:784 length:252 start_codon:yes stop_codon:yes gene_type:complete